MPAPTDPPTPAAAFALFDDNLAGSGDLWLEGPCGKLVCERADTLDATLAAIEAARAAGRWVAIAAAYELGYLLEPRLAPLLPAGAGPLLRAWVFERGRRCGAEHTEARLARAVAALDEHQRLAGIAALRPAIERADYLAAVAGIRRLIEDGDCYQVNFTWPLEGQAWGAPLALYQRLRAAQPVRHGAFITDGDDALLSRSPELFVRREGERLFCRPMKGTAPRSDDPRTLRDSEKNRAENLMIVDLIRNDLGRLAPPGGVRVDALFEVEGFSTVWQMSSAISAAPVSAGLATVLRALFPCGSVTGAPKIRAMEIIRALETAPRGIYCGALGWLAPDGDFCFNVPIRTLELAAGGRARLGLGSGIVADSEPAAEWEECLLKGRFLTGLPPPFGLIETLRCVPGSDTPYPLLELHLARLSASAAHFGIPCAPEALRGALLAHAHGLAGPHRVRLELSPTGAARIGSAALAPLPPGPVRLGLARARLRADDPLLRHKTTARALYDATLAAAEAAGCFDALFLNERGEVAEGARSTLFVDTGEGALLTPPLASGALDGVLRRSLLEKGEAREAVLRLADLASARRLHVGNALRGLVAAEFAPDRVCG